MGFIFPNLKLRLIPVLNRMAVVAAFLLIEFIGKFGDLRGHINWFLNHDVKNAPFYHRDFQGVVDDQARNHRIGENRECLSPRQRHKAL